MLEVILKKLGFDSAEAFIASENKIIEENSGYEVERKSPLLLLDFDELDFFQNYCKSKNLI